MIVVNNYNQFFATNAAQERPQILPPYKLASLNFIILKIAYMPEETKPLIYVQYPQPSGEKILKVLDWFMEKEKDYERRHETSFRKEVVKEILKKVNEIR